MKLIRITYDLARPVPVTLTLADGSDALLALKITVDGTPFDGTVSVEQDDTCLITASHSVADCTCFSFHADSTSSGRWTVVCTRNDNPVARLTLTILTVAASEYDVDYTAYAPEEEEEEPEPTVAGHRLVVGPNWNTEMSLQYDDGPLTYVRAGSEGRCTNVSYMGFALYEDLSGNTRSNALSACNLAMAGFNLSADTLLVQHQPGYTLHNELDYTFRMLKNRTTNAQLKANSYMINVACFRCDENICLRTGTGAAQRTWMVPAGEECFLSANTSAVNPFEES